MYSFLGSPPPPPWCISTSWFRQHARRRPFVMWNRHIDIPFEENSHYNKILMFINSWRPRSLQTTQLIVAIYYRGTTSGLFILTVLLLSSESDPKMNEFKESPELLQSLPQWQIVAAITHSSGTLPFRLSRAAVAKSEICAR